MHPAHAGPFPQGFALRSVSVGGREYPYQVYVPRPAPAAGLPVVCFLHGSGERGADGVAQTTVGLGESIRERPHALPALVVFPQAPEGSIWAGGPARAAMAALDAAAAEFAGDPRRVYLTGMSMGGFGTWQLATEHPKRFAALVPVCAGVRAQPGNPEVRVRGIPPAADPYLHVARRVGATPVWMFHGADDPVVPPHESRRMEEALRRAGGDVRYTEYPGVRHSSWKQAYAEPGLWKWLLAQRR